MGIYLNQLKFIACSRITGADCGGCVEIVVWILGFEGIELSFRGKKSKSIELFEFKSFSRESFNV